MQQSVRISDALLALAPWLGAEIATLLPFPHRAFFELPAARMHLLGLCLVGMNEAVIEPSRLAARKWSEATKLAFDPPPVGLESVLSKMSLPMWSPDDYRHLWRLMGCASAMECIRHASVVRAFDVELLSALPPALRNVSVTRHLSSPKEGRVLAYAFSHEKKARRFLQAVRQCKRRETFFRRAARIVIEAQFFDTVPNVNHPSITPIRNVDELRRAARRFRNCLSEYAARASIGEVAFYIYDADEPGVIMLSKGESGVYVLEQMGGANNAKLSSETERVVRTAFEGIGIGDRAHAAARKALDECLAGLAYSDPECPKEVQAHCDILLNRLVQAEA